MGEMADRDNSNGSPVESRLSMKDLEIMKQAFEVFKQKMHLKINTFKMHLEITLFYVKFKIRNFKYLASGTPKVYSLIF